MTIYREYFLNKSYKNEYLTHFLKIELDKLEIPFAHNLNGILNYIFKFADNPNMLRRKFMEIMTCFIHAIDENHQKYKYVDYVVKNIYELDKCVHIQDFDSCLHSLQSSEFFEDRSVVCFIICHARVIFDLFFSESIHYKTPLNSIRIAIGEEPWSIYLQDKYPSILKILQNE